MRSLRGLWIALGVLVALAVVVVVLDIALRAYAQGEAESQIESQLPANVEGDVQVHIGGASFLAQVITGRIGEVQLDAPELTVSGVPVEAHVTATGVPTDLSQPIDAVQASLTLDQDAVNSVIALPGDAQLELGEGTVAYDGELSILGFALGYRVEGTVTASGTDVVIAPQNAELTQGAANVGVDISQLLRGVTDDPIRLCVAGYLPEGASIDSLDITTGQVTANLSARDFVAGGDALGTLGTCS